MQIKLINIGLATLFRQRIIAIVSPESAPIKRVIAEARDRGMRLMLLMDAGHELLSSPIAVMLCFLLFSLRQSNIGYMPKRHLLPRKKNNITAGGKSRV